LVLFLLLDIIHVPSRDGVGRPHHGGLYQAVSSSQHSSSTSSSFTGTRLPPEPNGPPEVVVALEWVSVVGAHIDARRCVQFMMTRTHALWSCPILSLLAQSRRSRALSDSSRSDTL
jgi:hypothetical protein